MLKLLFTPEGAIPRKRFIIGLIVSLLIVVGLSLLIQITLNVLNISLGLTEYLCLVFVIVLGLWMKTCLMLKRISDLRVSRWLMVIPIATAYAARFFPSTWVLLACGLIGLLFFVLLLVWPSRQYSY